MRLSMNIRMAIRDLVLGRPLLALFDLVLFGRPPRR